MLGDQGIYLAKGCTTAQPQAAVTAAQQEPGRFTQPASALCVRNAPDGNAVIVITTLSSHLIGDNRRPMVGFRQPMRQVIRISTNTSPAGFGRILLRYQTDLQARHCTINIRCGLNENCAASV